MRQCDHIIGDLQQHHGRIRLMLFLKSLLTNRLLNPGLRLGLTKGCIPGVSLFAGLLLSLKQNRYGIKIVEGTEIGLGSYISFGGPFIIHPSAPIDDNIYDSTNVVLVEDITSCDNVSSGPGANLTLFLPDNCTAAGNPAHVLNLTTPSLFVIHCWPAQEPAT
jgi:hypothetical protein